MMKINVFILLTMGFGSSIAQGLYRLFYYNELPTDELIYKSTHLPKTSWQDGYGKENDFIQKARDGVFSSAPPRCLDDGDAREPRGY